MIKVILFDCDGIIVKEHKYFIQRLKEDFGIVLNYEAHNSFFKNEFLLCQAGKLDLKIELIRQMPKWGIDWSVEKLVEYWFNGERDLDKRVVETIYTLRGKGVKCYLSTNNEKYRTQYLTDEVDLKNILDGIYSSAFLGFMKSNQGFWQALYQDFLDIKKNQVLVFDNKQENVQSAREFGFSAELYKDFETFIRQLYKNGIVYA